MRPTRQGVTVGALAVALAGWAVLVAQPIVLIGAAGLGGFLVAVQLEFVRELARGPPDVTVTPGMGYVTAGESVPVMLDMAVEPAVNVRLTPRIPPSAEAEISTRTLAPTEEQTALTVDLTLPIAGTIQIPAPKLVASDRFGLFEQPLRVDAGAEITVRPRAPRNIHIGEGGEPIGAAFGEHPAGRVGSGLEPAEIRKYVPGEAVRQMDWKATARLGEPHVREFEAETDRETVLVLDTRGVMGQGRPGETKLDYAREVALGFVESARSLGDPLGYYIVGDEGFREIALPRTNPNHLRQIQQTVSGITPVDGDGRTDQAVLDPAAAGRMRDRLADDAFGAQLRPFLANRRAYVDRVETEPLFSAVRQLTLRERGTLWTIIFTDDSHRTELREAVRLARSGAGRVVVFLTPSVLFEEGLGEIEAAYDRYRDFEEFRRSLAGIERVQAYEVGPGDRIATVLNPESSRARRGGLS